MDILVGRIIIAGIVGFLMGLSIKRNTTARLFAIICMGAALVMVISTEFFFSLGITWYADPGRLAAQVIAALGFIGSGLIWIGLDKKVRGISTAAALWLTAIVGMVIGAGLRNISAGVIVILLIMHIGLTWYTGKYKSN